MERRGEMTAVLSEAGMRELCARIHDLRDRRACTMDAVRALLPWIASTDGAIRDDLVYVSLCDALEMGDFGAGDLTWVLDECLSDRYLFHGLGEAEGDGVFRRSFSLLVVDAVLDVQAKRRLLSAAALRRVWDRYVRYVADERDLRGYVPGKGWAHALAHGADVACSLIQLEVPGADDVKRLTGIWRGKLACGSQAFIDDEDERLLRAVFAALDTGSLSEGDLCGIAASYGEAPLSDGYFEEQHGGLNVKHMLMCWHIHAEERGLTQLASATFEALQTLKHRRGMWY